MNLSCFIPSAQRTIIWRGFGERKDCFACTCFHLPFTFFLVSSKHGGLSFEKRKFSLLKPINNRKHEYTLLLVLMWKCNCQRRSLLLSPKCMHSHVCVKRSSAICYQCYHITYETCKGNFRFWVSIQNKKVHIFNYTNILIIINISWKSKINEIVTKKIVVKLRDLYAHIECVKSWEKGKVKLKKSDNHIFHFLSTVCSSYHVSFSSQINFNHTTSLYLIDLLTKYGVRSEK